MTLGMRAAAPPLRLRTRLDRLDRQIDTVVDYRALALLRIAAGPLVLLHLAPFRRLAAQGLAYSDVFHVPYADWFPQVSRDGYFGLLNLATVAAVLLSVGLLTRVASIYTAGFVGYNLFLSQTHFHHNRAFLLILLIGLAVTPVGRVLSVDAWLRGRAGDGPGPGALARQWPLMLLRFELAAVYVASGVSKLIDPDWFGGLVNQIRVERSADLILDRGVPAWLLDVMLSSEFHAWSAKVIVATELFIGLGLLLPKLRLAALWIAVPFHVAIEVTAEVQVFSYAALAALVVWVTPSTRDREVIVRGPDARRNMAALRRLDWLARFRVTHAGGDGPALTLIDRPDERGKPVVRHGGEAAWTIASRLPLTFWLAAPALLPGIRRMWDRKQPPD